MYFVRTSGGTKTHQHIVKNKQNGKRPYKPCWVMRHEKAEGKSQTETVPESRNLDDADYRNVITPNLTGCVQAWCGVVWCGRVVEVESYYHGTSGSHEL